MECNVGMHTDIHTHGHDKHTHKDMHTHKDTVAMLQPFQYQDIYLKNTHAEQ